jgi:hypothetical protein
MRSFPSRDPEAQTASAERLPLHLNVFPGDISRQTIYDCAHSKVSLRRNTSSASLGNTYTYLEALDPRLYYLAIALRETKSEYLF